MVNKYTYMGIFTDNVNKVVNLNEFEKAFNCPHQTVKRHLDFLVKEKILKAEKKGKFLFYSVNKENRLCLEYLSICEKQQLIKFLENPLFRRIYSFIAPSLNTAKVLIFGSAVKSKNYKDIDILVLSKSNMAVKLLRDFEKTYSVRFHIIHTAEKDLTMPFLEEIKKNHMILNEHDYFLRLIYGNKL